MARPEILCTEKFSSASISMVSFSLFEEEDCELCSGS